MRVPVGGEAIAPKRLLVGIGELGHRPSPRSSGQVAMELRSRTGEASDAPGAQPLPVDGAGELLEPPHSVAAEEAHDIAPRFQGFDEANLAVPGVGVERVAGSAGAPGVLLKPSGSTRAPAGSTWRASARCWCRGT